MLSMAECHYAVCHYAECRCAECHYAECHYAECRYAECRYAECCGAKVRSLYEYFYDFSHISVENMSCIHAATWRHKLAAECS